MASTCRRMTGFNHQTGTLHGTGGSPVAEPRTEGWALTVRSLECELRGETPQPGLRSMTWEEMDGPTNACRDRWV